MYWSSFHAQLTIFFQEILIYYQRSEQRRARYIILASIKNMMKFCIFPAQSRKDEVHRSAAAVEKLKDRQGVPGTCWSQIIEMRAAKHYYLYVLAWCNTAAGGVVQKREIHIWLDYFSLRTNMS